MEFYPLKGFQKYLNLPLLLLLLSIGSQTFAQLNADFSLDRTGGCAPLVVNFTNQSTGASSNAVYKWDFGNGNTSALTQGAAVFTEPKTYTITLTVLDGANKSTQTKQVIVSRAPTLDFTVDAAKICLGSPVTFTANASPGDGAVSGYAWDFGDGSTTEGTSNIQSHQYGMVQLATVSLTVSNSYGCHTTLKKQNFVNIIPALTPGFTANKQVLCLVTDAVQFTNSSTGPGTLDYLWDFGDGNSSTALNPSHTFSKKGNYTVSLKVHSSEGCTLTSTQTNPLNVANYSTSFTVPSPICVGSNVSFNPQNSPTPDNSIWSVDGNPQYAYGALYYNFSTAGNHTVTLNNTFGTCPQSSTQTVSVKALPVPTAFSINVTGKCGSPVEVDFKDQTPGAVQWAWNFNTYNAAVTSNKQAPATTYAYDGSYLVTLQVTNADGCSASSSQYVQITTPTVSIVPAGAGTLSSCTTLLTNSFSAIGSEGVTITKWNFGDGGTSTAANPTHTFKNTGNYRVTLNYTTVNGCTGNVSYVQYSLPTPSPVSIYTTQSNLASCLTPITATFVSTSPQDPVVGFKWAFADGASSTDASPTHTYSNTGTYVTSLVYTTQAGCTGTAYAPPVIVDPKINLSFSENPNPVCGNSTVAFVTKSSTPDINTYTWSFGDGTGSYNTPNPTHQYSAAGDYTITLYVRNIGGCDTTMSQPITVKPPFPQVNGHTNTCAGTRGDVTFTQSSVGATTVTWSFGDGTSTTTPGNQTTIVHTYKKTGIYSVNLSATNGTCTLVVPDPNPVYVLVKQNPVLTGDKSSLCNTGSVNIQIAGFDVNPYQSNNVYNNYYYSGYYFQETQYRDGTVFYPNLSNNINNYRWTTTYNGTMSNFQSGEKDVRMILTSYGFGCQDTTNYMPLAIKGAIGGFEVAADQLCYQSPVVLQDTSSSTSNNPILSWQWNFGDGQSLTSSKGGKVTHSYANPGSYQVTMQINDAAGCAPNSYTQYVTVKGPKASFTPSGTDVHLNTTVYFNNTTNDYGNSNTVYTWNFGDGTTSNDVYPSHTYPVPGTYTVTMTASNPGLPCSSTATPVTIIVRNFNSAFAFSSSYVTGGCAPLLVSFTNTSYNYVSVSWDFGDGITAGNVNYPSHIYEKPGKYIVTLNVNAYNGITGTYIDSIIIRPPAVTSLKGPPETCIDSTVVLSSTSQNASSSSWDFGDGTVVPASGGMATHQYLTAGTYDATLLVQNDAGCTTDSTLQKPVVIRPAPTITLTPNDKPVILCKNSTVNLEATGGSTYQWTPATGLSSAIISNPVASPLVTTNYTLTVRDDIGCPNSASLSIKVIPPGNLEVSKDDTVCSGESVKLIASGEEVYQWIDNTTGLSDVTIPDPLALAPSTILYTVKGSDTYSCFVDERSVTVTVRPLPTVDAGPDVLVEAGYTTNLTAITSNDVVAMNWQPAKYLSCYDCPTPVCTPLATTAYFATVMNEYGCKATDTVVVAVDCQETHVRIPNAFTPNGNGENDVFVVKGISIVKHMAIFDRWGAKVYEKDNFIAGDRASCWDGTFRGQPCPVGTYVYFIEMECPSGGTFSRKGSLVLIR